MQKRPEGRSFAHLTSPAPFTVLPIERITECQGRYHIYSTTFVLVRQMTTHIKEANRDRRKAEY